MSRQPNPLSPDTSPPMPGHRKQLMAGWRTSDDILARLAPTARREKPLVIECDQERRTTETVTSWLETIRG